MATAVEETEMVLDFEDKECIGAIISGVTNNRSAEFIASPAIRAVAMLSSKLSKMAYMPTATPKELPVGNGTTK